MSTPALDAKLKPTAAPAGDDDDLVSQIIKTTLADARVTGLLSADAIKEVGSFLTSSGSINSQKLIAVANKGGGTDEAA